MKHRLKVATWNCHGVPAGLWGLLAGKPRLPARFRLHEIGRALGCYDVVCVQETFLGGVARFFERLASGLGMHLWHDGMMPRAVRRGFFGGGLAILATQPLDVAFEAFPGEASGWDAFASKGFATCVLRTPAGQPFRLVNLHMQADDPRDEPHVFRAVRATQIGALLRRLDADGPRTPTLVCGDLNVHEGSDEYRAVLLPAMDRHGFVDVAHGLGLATFAPRRNALVRLVERDVPEARLDYVWARGGGGAVWRTVSPPQLVLSEPMPAPHSGAPPVFASDHFGIGVELELRDPSGSG